MLSPSKSHASHTVTDCCLATLEQSTKAIRYLWMVHPELLLVSEKTALGIY